MKSLEERNMTGMEEELFDKQVKLYFGRVKEAIAIMQKVSEWGREKQLRIWPKEWLTREELLTQDTTEEDFGVAKAGGESIGAFILQRQDGEYWPDALKGEAVYLHKLCVRREFAHQNTARKIVEAIACKCRQEGISYIRLDTALDEKKVRKIYLGMGFKIVDIIDYENARSMALYEYEVMKTRHK